MKLSKRNIFHLCLLTGIYLVFVLLLTRFEYAYGSELDWGGQHYAIPDYFRKLFYKTGDIFPSFAPNIGGGENIYNLSYYGLYSPIIMFSYFFMTLLSYEKFSKHPVQIYLSRFGRIVCNRQTSKHTRNSVPKYHVFFLSRCRYYFLF